MKTESIFTPNLGEQVIRTLSRYAKLPAKGVVAGQAVASAIDEILGKGKPVYNDIDVFLDDERWAQRWPEDVARRHERQRDEKGYMTRDPEHGLLAGPIQYMHDTYAESDGYARYVRLGHRMLYSIEQSRTEGMLNYVCVNWDASDGYDALRSNNPHKRARFEMDALTRVFDLNCTQAAVDLETGRWHTTPLFEQYFRTRQLQVVTGFTPVHSLLRYLKKRAELGAYGDDATHLALAQRLVRQAQGDAVFSQARRRAFREGRVGVSYKQLNEDCERLRLPNPGYSGWHRAGSGHGNQPLSFGRKYLNLYLKHQKLLNEHFMLTRHNRRDLWLLTSKTAATSEDSDTVSLSPAVVALRFAESRQAPSKQAIARQAGLAELIEAMKDEPGASYALERTAVNIGQAYTDGMEDANLRKRWLEVCPKHTEFFWPIAALPFRDQVALIRRTRTEFKKVGIREPWGALMRENSSWVGKLLHDDSLWATLIEEHAGTLEPLCKPLPLPAQLGDVAVRELLSSRDLTLEGAKQHHCVGTYTSSVRAGHCRIVSFALSESSKDCSTAEWRIQVKRGLRDANGKEPVTGVVFECNQHQGFSNTEPPEALASAEEQAREHLNVWAQAHLEEAIRLLGISESAPGKGWADDDDFF